MGRRYAEPRVGTVCALQAPGRLEEQRPRQTPGPPRPAPGLRVRPVPRLPLLPSSSQGLRVWPHAQVAVKALGRDVGGGAHGTGPPTRWGGSWRPGEPARCSPDSGGGAEVLCGFGEEPVLLGCQGCQGCLSQWKEVPSEDGVHSTSGLPDPCGQGRALWRVWSEVGLLMAPQGVGAVASL